MPKDWSTRHHEAATHLQRVGFKAQLNYSTTLRAPLLPLTAHLGRIRTLQLGNTCPHLHHRAHSLITHFLLVMPSWQLSTCKKTVYCVPAWCGCLLCVHSIYAWMCLLRVHSMRAWMCFVCEVDVPAVCAFCLRMVCRRTESQLVWLNGFQRINGVVTEIAKCHCTRSFFLPDLR